MHDTVETSKLFKYRACVRACARARVEFSSLESFSNRFFKDYTMLGWLQ